MLILADASSDVQLAGVMAATIVETWTHGVLQKGARLLTRCGAICSNGLQGWRIKHAQGLQEAWRVMWDHFLPHVF